MKYNGLKDAPSIKEVGKFQLVKISNESKGPHNWEYTHEEIWRVMDMPNEEDIQSLMKAEYSMFPVVRSSYEFSDDKQFIIVKVIEDNCR